MVLHCESCGLSSMQGFSSCVLIVPLFLVQKSVMYSTRPLMRCGQHRCLLSLPTREIILTSRGWAKIKKLQF